MRKVYLFFYLFIGVLILGFATSCGEKEDIVMPQACEIMAQVQYQENCGVHLLLDNGQILLPANMKLIPAAKEGRKVTINGFEVEEGQHIIIGYTPVAGGEVTCGEAGGKPVQVTCIVGFKTR